MKVLSIIIQKHCHGTCKCLTCLSYFKKKTGLAIFVNYWNKEYTYIQQPIFNQITFNLILDISTCLSFIFDTSFSNHFLSTKHVRWNNLWLQFYIKKESKIKKTLLKIKSYSIANAWRSTIPQHFDNCKGILLHQFAWRWLLPCKSHHYSYTKNVGRISLKITERNFLIRNLEKKNIQIKIFGFGNHIRAMPMVKQD